MAEFHMQIAGHTGRVISLFQSTREHFRPYLTQNDAQFTVCVEPADLTFEQEELLKEARLEGFKPRIFPDPFLERAAIQRSFAEFLFDRNILLVHGSLVAVDGQGYLFTAKSGTGKSTHTRLWREVFGERAVMVNDDKPFLQLQKGQVLAYGSPWCGKHGLHSNICVPLKGICYLRRGADNRIEPMPAQQLLPTLQKESYCPLAEEKRPTFLALVEKLSRQVPLWQMDCNKLPQAAQMAYDAMSE